MDPLRSDTRPAEALSGTEREARIEQLLLAGLDEYFAHRYEHAIHLWTRVLFLDRHHDRARAYIERARRAQAERQRESDALVQQAQELFAGGDVPRARQLLEAALERGASRADLHEVIERVERLDAVKAAPARLRRHTAVRTTSAPQREPVPDSTPSRSWGGGLLVATACIALLSVAAWAVVVSELPTWSTTAAAPSPARPIAAPATAPLPVPTASEVYMARARRLTATGRLHDALAALDRIALADPLRADADRLRADIQRRLLTLAAAEDARE